MDTNAEDDDNKTTNKANTKPPIKEEKKPTLMSEDKQKRKYKHDAIMDEKIKRLFSMFTENTQKQLTKQAEKHAIQIAEMKRTTIEAHHIVMNETMATQPVNDHRASVHFTVMTKACDLLFDGQP
jgi:hypothetical protein